MEAGQSSWSDLEQAIETQGSVEEITRLLDTGAPTIAPNASRDGSALSLAVATRREDVVSLLLDRNADINEVVGGEYGTALIAAVLWEIRTPYRCW